MTRGPDGAGPTLRASVTRRFGEPGRAWLAALPGLEARLAERWGLELGEELAGRHLVSARLVRRRDGAEAVLKVSGPWHRADDEAACLVRWDGGPAPRLLAADPAAGALLLERVLPGTPAHDAAAADVAQLLGRLHVPPWQGLPPLLDAVRVRVEEAGREGRATPQRVAWALDAIGRLAAGGPAPVLVHGAFDGRSVLLCGRRGICATDPLPAAGDGAYDAASWIHANRRPGRRARFEALAAATGLDRARLRDWCGVVAVHG